MLNNIFILKYVLVKHLMKNIKKYNFIYDENNKR
jgi:hypothetical protein